ncbi:uracil-DNA glycosylase [Ralstonia solanacearum]|uniref:uracil-DNA glycosylase n=1 Tax=Ralstonia solanacearum TaxID=305 RepID=UPI001FF9B89C|nr:uracil-DNA glycosylase [Ralstonia solanacearum]MDB0527791.1 uracil-DNA glycosylase [Ralstonia solanacearum]
MGAQGFVDAVSSIVLANTFNPYSSQCPTFDKNGASEKRKAILLALVRKAVDSGVDSIWIGRDLGYRGGRRTGLALTDEVNIENHARRWKIDARRVTKGSPVSERTAAIIWNALNHVTEDVFLWNVFPLHPYEEGNPFTNRAHNAYERNIGEAILSELIALVRPRRLVAVGNDAVASATKVSGGIAVLKFRHPSYGGQNIFYSQVESVYGVRLNGSHQRELFE